MAVTQSMATQEILENIMERNDSQTQPSPLDCVVEEEPALEEEEDNGDAGMEIAEETEGNRPRAAGAVAKVAQDGQEKETQSC